MRPLTGGDARRERVRCRRRAMDLRTERRDAARWHPRRRRLRVGVQGGPTGLAADDLDLRPGLRVVDVDRERLGPHDHRDVFAAVLDEALPGTDERRASMTTDNVNKTSAV